MQLVRTRSTSFAALLGAALAVAACSSEETSDTSSSSGSSNNSSTTTTSAGGMGGMGSGGMGGGGMLPFALTSSAFMEGGTIPTEHECGAAFNGPGNDVSPPLSWTPGPPGTMSYALVMHDRDFMNLVHWVLYDIPATTTSLPADIPTQYQPPEPAGSKQASIQGQFFGYLGPCSPNSINTYEWTIHAMSTDTLPSVDMNTADTALATQIETTSIASASLSGES